MRVITMRLLLWVLGDYACLVVVSSEMMYEATVLVVLFSEKVRGLLIHESSFSEAQATQN